MSDFKSLLLWLLKNGQETEWLEFKENNCDPDEIGKRISALSNGACLTKIHTAYLVFGVNDKTLDPVGTSFNPRIEKKGNEPLENWLLQRLSPKIDFVIKQQEIEGKHFVIFEIPPATNQPVSFSNISYVRVGSITRKLLEFPEKERKIWKSQPDNAFANAIAMNSLDATDITEYLDTQKYFELIKIPYPSTREAVIERFIHEKLIINDRGRYSITNLGAISFAKNLRQFSTLYRKAPRLVIYAGTNKLNTVRDITGERGYIVAFQPLIEFIDGQLPSNEEISKVIRSSVTMYPKDALRELIANCLIHQDFSERGTGPMIEIYSDRIEITNPGLPLIRPLRFIDEYQSRNEELANLYRRLGICEEKGSGVDRVILLSEMYQLPAPNWIQMEKHTKAILYAHKKHSMMNKEEKIRACYQHCVLKYISNNHMTNQTLRERFGIEQQNAAIASRIIADTHEAGLIKFEDPESKSKKYARYIPNWA